MDRVTVQRHIASVLAKYDRPVEGLLVELEVDRAESGKVGMIGYSKNGKRIATRVGKFVRQFFGDDMDDQTVQNIGADITAKLWSGSGKVDDPNGVKELEGEDLRRFYLIGPPSCMAHESTQDFLNIYVDNPDKVKLATVTMDYCHTGRALVWTFPNGRRYMDRIYHTSEACHAALKNYRDENGIGTRDSMPATKIEMKIRNGEDSYWPYMDTLCYMDIVTSKTCTLSRDDGAYFLQHTDGTCDDSGYRCYGCGGRMYEGEEYIGPDNEYYCEGCFDDHFFVCRCGRTEYNEDGHDTYHDGYVCNSCYEYDYFECEDCGRVLYYSGNHNEVDGREVCNSCYEDNYFGCSECGERFDKDVLVDGLCSDCAADKMVETAREEVASA